MMSTRHRLARLLNIVILLTCALPCFGESTSLFEINIPPSSRQEALIALASQTDYDIIFGKDIQSQDIPTQASVAALVGHYSTLEALAILLKDSGLAYTLVGKQIRIKLSPQQIIVLSKITVLGYLRNESQRIGHEQSEQEEFPLYQVPLSIQSVSREYMDEVQALNTDDVIAYISGIEHFEDAGGIHPQYYSRGIPTALSVDGKIFRRTILELDPAVLERIDLIQGPSANYLPPGGLLNFVTKKPLKKSHSQISLTGGSYDFYRSEVDLNFASTRDKQLAIRVIGVAETKKDIKDFVFQEKTVFAPKLSIEFAKHSQFVFSLYQQRQKEYPNTLSYHDSVLDQDIPREQTIGLPWARTFFQDSTIAAEYSNTHWKNWRLSSGINANDYRSKSSSAVLLSAVDAEGNAAIGHSYSKDISIKSHGFDASAERGISIFGVSALLRIGAENQRFHQYFPSYATGELTASDPNQAAQFNIYQPDYNRFKEPLPPPRIGLYEQLSNYSALYLSQSFYLTDKLTLHADFRYENMEFDASLSDSTIGLDWKVKGHYKEFMPQFGLNTTLSDSLSSHIAYSESFSHQTIFDAEKISNPLILRSDFVAPILNRQIEFALKKIWQDGNISSSLTWYKLKRSNILSLAFDNETLRFNNPEVEDQFSYGVSLDINGSITPNLHLVANISRNNNTINSAQFGTVGDYTFVTPSTESNKRTRSTAKLIANTWLNYQVTRGMLKKFDFGFGIKYVGDRYGDDDNSFILASYTKVDTTIKFNYSEKLNISLAIRNVLNRDYYAGSSGSTSAVEEGDPRSFYLTIKSTGGF